MSFLMHRRCFRFPTTKLNVLSFCHMATYTATSSIIPASDEMFKPIMDRIANIINSVTDRRPSKILHFHPEYDLVSSLGKSTAYELTGCTSAPDSVNIP